MIRTALIPAAGRGARLDRPGTPKPLVDVGGKPLIFRLLSQLSRVGVRRAVVVLGYQARKIREALARQPAAELSIEIVENPRWEDGLARSILSAREQLSEPFLLTMADHVFDDRLVAQMAALDPASSAATALIDPRAHLVCEQASAVKVRRKGARIVEIGVMTTPALVIDGDVKVSGRLPSIDEIREMLV